MLDKSMLTKPVFTKTNIFFLAVPFDFENVDESTKQNAKQIKSHRDTKSDRIRSATDPCERPSPCGTTRSATATHTVAKEIQFPTRIIYRRCLKPISPIAPWSDLRRPAHPTPIVMATASQSGPHPIT